MEIRCGFDADRYYELSSLLCGNIAGIPLDKVLDRSNPIECQGIAEKMSSNIIRVASSRIFIDPYRSFVEPVSNSIDSYNLLKGKKSIGKFGMGFFSLLYWLDHKDSTINVSSFDGNCEWNLYIIKRDSKFYFKVSSNTGGGIRYTRVTLKNVPLEPDDIKKVIYNTFMFVDDITIKAKISSKEKLVNSGYNNGSKDIIRIESSRNHIQFEDNATGIKFSDIFSKLLIPSISTKTLSTFIRSEKGSYKPSRVEVGNGFCLTIGDIVIYNQPSEKAQKKDLFVLSLPSEFPMPVSRDDIIVETQQQREILFNSLIDLLRDIVKMGNSIDELFNRLTIYMSYANDRNVDGVISSFIDHVGKLDNIILAPKGNRKLYSKLETGDIRIIESSTPDSLKLTNFILKNHTYKNKMFNGVNVVSFPLKFQAEKVVRITPDVLLVDPSIINKPSSIITTSPVYLTPYGKGSHRKEVREILKEGYLDINGLIHSNDSKLIDEVVEACLPFYEVAECMVNATGYKKNLEDVLVDVYILLVGYYKAIGDISRVKNVVYYLYSSIFKMTFPGSHRLEYQDMSWTRLENTDYLGYLGDPDNYSYIPAYSERLLKYYHLVSSIILDETQFIILASNPANLSLVNTPYLTKHIPEALKFLNGVDIIYDYAISLVFREAASRNFYISDPIATLKYIYSELSSKKGVKVLNEIYRAFIYHNDREVIMLAQEMINSLSVYNKVQGSMLKVDNRGIDYRYLPNICFRATQLIEYIFHGNPNYNSPNWLVEVSNMSGNVSLQTIEITINEGTSKPYVESILTELLQNSIDASMSLQNPTIEIIVDERGITVTDQVGIPFGGIVSLMVPFLSTKSQSSLTTGEMGSGFMNVFRQPGTEYVRVYTKDPSSGNGYLLYGYPIIDGDRVIDVKYELSMVSGYDVAGTEIFVSFKTKNKEKLSSDISSGLVFSYINMGVVGSDVYINKEKVERKLVLLESNQIADIYVDPDIDSIYPTVILTNGVPYMLYTNEPGDYEELRSNLMTGAVINIKKDAYTPVQTRKRINIVGDLNEFYTYVALQVYMYRVINDGDKVRPYYYEIKQTGDPRQYRPSHRITFSEGVEDPDSVYESFYVPKIRSKDNGFKPLTDPYGYANKLYDQMSLGIVINLMIDRFELGDTDWSEQHISELTGIRGLSLKVVALWFSNKSKEKSKYTAKPLASLNYSNTVMEIIKGPLLEFTSMIVSKIWQNVRQLTSGFNMRPQPPTVHLVSEIDGALGFYDPNKHKITLAMKGYNLNELSSAVKELTKLMKAGDSQEVALYYRRNFQLNKFIGANVIPSTIVHEFGHAVRGESHKDANIHGNFIYKVGDTEYNYTYEKGCNEIWRMGLIGIWG